MANVVKLLAETGFTNHILSKLTNNLYYANVVLQWICYIQINDRLISFQTLFNNVKPRYKI